VTQSIARELHVTYSQHVNLTVVCVVEQEKSPRAASADGQQSMVVSSCDMTVIETFALVGIAPIQGKQRGGVS
jgi:hypothetical protein